MGAEDTQPVTPSLAYAASSSLRGAVAQQPVRCPARWYCSTNNAQGFALFLADKMSHCSISGLVQEVMLFAGGMIQDFISSLCPKLLLEDRGGFAPFLPCSCCTSISISGSPVGPCPPGSTHPQVGAGVAQGGQHHCSLT